ncbi:uncharacterized protein LOC134782464 [Penaeus indicus]|uniref:uncharacterized protein LOC134782464 n=1 Tax=Penaeus indicus TaxID=29960 RepID=UPI00300C132D
MTKMNSGKRASSAKNSRRRRWEVKSKESFETSLAVEFESPEKSQKSETEENTGSTSSLPKDKEEATSATSKPRKSTRSKSATPSKVIDEEEEDDLLSARIAALIEEASIKSKDSPKAPKEPGSIGPTKEKHKEPRTPVKPEPKENPELILVAKNDKNIMFPNPFDTPVKHHTIEQESFTPTAPPYSPGGGVEEIPRKKKQKKKSDSSRLMLVSSKNEESVISVQLRDLGEDVVEVSREYQDPVVAMPSLLLAPSTSTPGQNNISTIYHEQLNGFIISKNNGNGRQRLSESLHDVNQSQTRGSHALFLQNGFRSFCVLCQGLLAGITLAHCLLIFLFDVEPMTLPRVYTPRMAHVFYSLIIFLSTICFVAACDRCDLRGAGVFSGHGIRVPWTPGFYLASLVLSLVAIRAEDALTHYHLYKAEALQKEQIGDLVDWWRWMCITRSLLAVLAWLAVVPDPHTDALLDYLKLLQQ